MKNKKLRLAGALLLVVTLIVVGVLVWPQPKEAMAHHPMLDIDFEILWDGPEPWWVDVTVQLCDENGVPIDYPVKHLTPDGNFMWWSGTMLNVPDDLEGGAWKYQISWITGDYVWDQRRSWSEILTGTTIASC